MTNKFEEQASHWMNEWSKKLEEMRVQFSIGKMDAVEAFEKQKDQLRTHLQQWKAKTDELVANSEHEAKKMKAAMELLMLHLNLGKADATNTFEEQRKKIELALHEVYVTAKVAYKNNFEHLMQAYDTNAKAFKTNLEIIQLQFALGKMDAKDEAENIRKQLETKIHELQAQYADTIKQGVDAWSKLMQDNYEKFKTWTNDFTQKGK